MIGPSGAGKSTMALSYVHAALGRGEPILMLGFGETMQTLRFFGAEGRIRRAVSVPKRRTGGHEDTIREFGIDSEGLRVGSALNDFRGVLTGIPVFEGEPGFAPEGSNER